MPTCFDPALIEMIRCPLTKSRLHPATNEIVDQLNSRIEIGEVQNQIGQTVHEKIDDGFVNENSTLLLPVRGGIIILVTDQAIPL